MIARLPTRLGQKLRKSRLRDVKQAGSEADLPTWTTASKPNLPKLISLGAGGQEICLGMIGLPAFGRGRLRHIFVIRQHSFILSPGHLPGTCQKLQATQAFLGPDTRPRRDTQRDADRDTKKGT
jgi:hypothetical protein